MVVEAFMEEIVLGNFIIIIIILWVNVYFEILTIIDKILEFSSFILYEGIQTTQTNVIGHLIGDIEALLEAGALQGFLLSLSISHTRSHKHRKVHKTVV